MELPRIKKPNFQFNQSITFKNRFTCERCGKAFTSNKDCERHVQQVHEGIRRHFCHQCGKAFFNKADANRHIDAVHLNLPDVWKRKKKS